MFPGVNAPHQCSRMTKGSGGGRSEAGAVGEGESGREVDLGPTNFLATDRWGCVRQERAPAPGAAHGGHTAWARRTWGARASHL